MYSNQNLNIIEKKIISASHLDLKWTDLKHCYGKKSVYDNIFSGSD